MISAFGVDHGEISKGVSTIPYHVRQGAKAVKTGTAAFARKHPDATAAGAGAGIGTAIGVGVDDSVRRVRNKRSGTNITLGQMFRHPYQSNAKWTVASNAKKGKTF